MEKIGNNAWPIFLNIYIKLIQSSNLKFCDITDVIEETGACNDKVDYKASRLYLEDQLEKFTKYFDPKVERKIKEKASVFDEFDLITRNRNMVHKTLSTLDEKEKDIIKKNKIVETAAKYYKEMTEILQNQDSSFDQTQPKTKAKQPQDQPQRRFGSIGAETHTKDTLIINAKPIKRPKSPTRRQIDSIDRQLNNEHRRQGRGQFQQNTNQNYDPLKQTGTRSSEFKGAQHINPKSELHGQTLSQKESPRSYESRPFFITHSETRSLGNLLRYHDSHVYDGRNRHDEYWKMPEKNREKDQETKWESTEIRRLKFGKQWTSHH